MKLPLPKDLGVEFRRFLDICLFRKRPQDLPAAIGLFWLAVMSYTILSIVLCFSTQSIIIAMLCGIIESVVLLFITFVFLYLRSVPQRWIQVATALAGTGAVFSLIVIPLYYARGFLQASPTADSLIVMTIIFFWFWNISVMSFILKHGLSSSYLLAALGALAYVAISMLSLQKIITVSQSIT